MSHRKPSDVVLSGICGLGGLTVLGFCGRMEKVEQVTTCHI
jgi:hypothetical protein